MARDGWLGTLHGTEGELGLLGGLGFRSELGLEVCRNLSLDLVPKELRAPKQIIVRELLQGLSLEDVVLLLELPPALYVGAECLAVEPWNSKAELVGLVIGLQHDLQKLLGLQEEHSSGRGKGHGQFLFAIVASRLEGFELPHVDSVDRPGNTDYPIAAFLSIFITFDVAYLLYG